MEQQSSKKRYYWLKLNEGFFDDPIIKKLRKIAGGDTFTCIYLKMMLTSLKTDGILEYEGIEDSFEKELALKLDEDATNIEIVIKYLFSHNLLSEESKKNRFYLMPAVRKMTGSEGNSAQRVREFRSKQKYNLLTCNSQNSSRQDGSLQCNSGVTDEQNQDMLHCNGAVTQSNVDVITCNPIETECNAKSYESTFSSEALKNGVKNYEPLHCNNVVTQSNQSETTETDTQSYCSSSYLKDTTTATYTSPQLKKWLSLKSQGKTNPQGYEYTLLKKYQDGEPSVIEEFKNWYETQIVKIEQEKLITMRGKKILTTLGEKIILGVEKIDNSYTIYFEEGGKAEVSSLIELERRSS